MTTVLLLVRMSSDKSKFECAIQILGNLLGVGDEKNLKNKKIK